MMKIKLKNKSAFTLVDDQDYEKYCNMNWYLFGGYAIRVENRWSKNGIPMRRTFALHREIMATENGLLTDHINGDKLDNRRSNLRVCTPSQNCQNIGITKANTSGYKGVSISRRTRKKWLAGIKKDGIFKRIGLFETKEEAALAYNQVAKELFGEYAYINKVGNQHKK